VGRKKNRAGITHRRGEYSQHPEEVDVAAALLQEKECHTLNMHPPDQEIREQFHQRTRKSGLYPRFIRPNAALRGAIICASRNRCTTNSGQAPPDHMHF
jgi:hypothetical protein